MNLTHLVAFRFLRGAGESAGIPLSPGEILATDVFISQVQASTQRIAQVKATDIFIEQLVEQTVER